MTGSIFKRQTYQRWRYDRYLTADVIVELLVKENACIMLKRYMLDLFRTRYFLRAPGMLMRVAMETRFEAMVQNSRRFQSHASQKC